MNELLRKLEKKVGRYAIPNLSLYMIACYGVGYVMQMINPQIELALSLNPYAILHGQVWRLFTWLIIPPETDNLFFTLIMLYFYFSIGRSLEHVWGTFYFNYYIFSGAIFMIIASFVMYFLTPYFYSADTMEYMRNVLDYTYGSCRTAYGGDWFYAVNSLSFSTYYVCMSMFLAYAATFPEAVVYLFFMLPIKVKVLGVIFAIVLIYEAWGSGVTGMFILGAAFLNFIIFFFTARKNLHGFYSFTNPRKRRGFGNSQKNQEAQKPKMRPEQTVAKHKCAICGQTSESNPDLQFRFCSKCEGNYEYCQEHLFTHQHVKR